MSITCHQIQRTLYFDTTSSSEITMPNFTPATWFECDFFRVTRAGYFYEYEIKMSVSDFRVDKKKSEYDRKTGTWVTKHQRLAERDTQGPSRYYFVMPSELAEKIKDEIPNWAGLIVFDRHLRCAKQAPILHRTRISRAVIRQAKQSALGRFWDLHIRHPDLDRIKFLTP